MKSLTYQVAKVKFYKRYIALKEKSWGISLLLRRSLNDFVGIVYNISIEVATLPKAQWEEITKLCQNSVESLQALSEGKFSKTLEGLFNEPKYGLFPTPKEINFNCSCPDYAMMCKHVACVLYGFASKLDVNPLLFFKLRDVNIDDLLKTTVEEKIESMLKNVGKKTSRTLSNHDIKDIFQI